MTYCNWGLFLFFDPKKVYTISMKTYITMLRGINVSGQKQVRMAELKSLYESIGFADVETYVQSGNVVFESKEKDAKNLQTQSKLGSRKRSGFPCQYWSAARMIFDASSSVIRLGMKTRSESWSRFCMSDRIHQNWRT
jgi:hypothetical protein